MKNSKNNLILLIYTILIGLIAGSIIWSFIKIMNLGINFFWNYLPGILNFKYYTVILCLIGGLIVGLWKHKFGDSPENLDTVILKVKTDHRYSYNNILPTIVSAILPLIFGASIGPEAGLSAIIAGLSTWVGDKLKKFNQEIEELTNIGVNITLGTIFISPIFGFVEPLENEDEIKLPKTSKNILYFAAIMSSFGIFIFLNHLTNTRQGLHSLGSASLLNLNYFYILILVLLGVILAYFYFITHKLIKKTFQGLNDNFILKGLIGGLILGIMGTLLPLTMFSGEHQIDIILKTGMELGVLVLILISIMKIILTNICIETGLKGGHFFPLIFSGISMGYAMSLILNIDPIVSMSVLTTSFLANILKKPIAVVLLLMILFPANLIPLMIVVAIIACLFKTPPTLLKRN